MSLNNLFKTMKQEGVVQRLEQHLALINANEADADRKNETNSPSSINGCSRANYYQRLGTPRDPIDPRARRIFDNGHGVHERLQKYLTDAGILLMDEVPVFNKKYEIQGHTDGLLSYYKTLIEIIVLEIKSINSRGFATLREPKQDHIEQACSYIFTLEEQRKLLRKTYKTLVDYNRSRGKRAVRYAMMYKHLKSGRKYSRKQKVNFKVLQHLALDDILYRLKKPITKAEFLYECKDTQEIKSFVIHYDEKVMKPLLDKCEFNNENWRNKTCPPRECKNKSEGRYCSYASHCFH